MRMNFNYKLLMTSFMVFGLLTGNIACASSHDEDSTDSTPIITRTITTTVENAQWLDVDTSSTIFKYAAQNGTHPAFLSTICKFWEEIIDSGSNKELEGIIPYSERGPFFQELLKTYHGMTSENVEFYKTFANGELHYRPDLESDKDMITLKTSDFPDPFKGRFDLSNCSYIAPRLVITTDPGDFFDVTEDNHKLNILIALRDVIGMNLETTCAPIQYIMGDWDGDTAPIGIFFRCTAWNNLSRFDYVTSGINGVIPSDNFYKLWRDARCGVPQGAPLKDVIMMPLKITKDLSQKISFSFVN